MSEPGALWALSRLGEHDDLPYAAPCDDRLALLVAEAHEHGLPPEQFLLPQEIRDIQIQQGVAPVRDWNGIPVRYYGGDLVILLCADEASVSFRMTRASLPKGGAP